MDEENWDDYIEHARRYIDSGQIEKKELAPKRASERELAAIRDAVLAGNPNWAGIMEKAKLEPRLCDWRDRDNMQKWFRNDPQGSRDALRRLWAPGGQSRETGKRPVSDADVLDRIRAFVQIKGHGVPIRPISVLLMALGAERYPPFQTRTFNETYRRIGYSDPPPGSDEAGLYKHALGFLDRLVEEAQAQGLDRPSDRLEAQSVVWALATYFSDRKEPDAESGDLTSNGSGQDSGPCDLQALADELLFNVEWLRKVEGLLDDNGQIIFQGPPGTGKTFVARKLAACLAGSQERVRLVQFHPSYAYEDFFQGHRPALQGGRPGFALRNGPLLEAAARARDEPDARHFLVIDEINRGNLARVFGELYFLLENRGDEICLQYSNEPFSLPGNLRIIGTMNTADRSIALVDLALRRRFYFVEFRPDEPPVRGLLRRWLEKNAPGMSWVADVVDRANRALDDRQAAIGPSYFMKPRLDEDAVRRIWKHKLLPYLEERLAGEHDRLRDFDLDRLRASEPDGGAGEK